MEEMKANYKNLLPLIIVGENAHQILLNDKQRMMVFNFIANQRGQIELESKVFCELIVREGE